MVVKAHPEPETVTRETFEGWVILELMGHRRIAGRCAEQKIAGAEVLRIDIEIRQLEHAPAGAHAAGSPYDDDVPV